MLDGQFPKSTTLAIYNSVLFYLFAILIFSYKYLDHLSYRQPVGCYKDSAKNHFLKGFKYSFPETNNPDNCANTCLRAGYAFAGRFA